MASLRDKNIILTGGGQGIGLAIAEELIRHRANFVLSYRSSRESALKVVQSACDAGCRALALEADLLADRGVEDFVAEAAKFLGSVDSLINNVGDLVERRLLQDVNMESYRRILDVNLASTMRVTQAAMPHLIDRPDGASVVNLSSLAGRKGGHKGSLLYSTAKGAILTFTRALAAELGPQGVRVNAVAPGLILGTQFHKTHTTPDSANETINGIPLGRAGRPEDVARAVVYLASEFDGFITGATLDINGGVYCA